MVTFPQFMKQLLTRIEGLEESVTKVVGHISSLKEENRILSQENNRLQRELNQLRKSRVVKGSNEVPGVNQAKDLSERDINIVPIKEELDRCIEEVEQCLRHI